MQLPRERVVTFVTVGLCTERRNWRKWPVWEEQSFAQRSISCYDLEGQEGSPGPGSQGDQNQFVALTEENQ